VMRGHRPHGHAALAARLRGAGWPLALTQADAVVGLAWKPLEVADLGEAADVLLAIGEPTPRGELEVAREEVLVLAEQGRRLGLSGRLSVEEHLFEVILGRSPRLVERLRDRVLGPLAGSDRGELALTLQTLLACRLDRTAASKALHVHRNTLAYRLKRIEELTGLDLDRPRDLACAYAALAGDLGEVPRRP
jgi:hypothetical protein